MNIPDTAVLRKAIVIKTEIERLERQLHDLFASVSSSEMGQQSSFAKNKTISKKSGAKRGRPRAASVSDALGAGALAAASQEEPRFEEKGEADSQHHEGGASAAPACEENSCEGVVEAHGEPLLLNDDSGEEQLAIIPSEEICQFEAPHSSEHEASHESNHSPQEF